MGGMRPKNDGTWQWAARRGGQQSGSTEDS